MAENNADVNELKARLPSNIPESVIRSTLVKCRGDKQKCYDTLTTTTWKHGALDAHVVSPEHFAPPSIRRINTYGPDALHQEVKVPYHAGSPWKPDKESPFSSLIEAQRRQLDQLKLRCDELMKQLSWAKSQSDSKKDALTELRCIQIPTSQELEFEKDLIRTLESDVESKKQPRATTWKCNFCQFNNHILMATCEKCLRTKAVSKLNMR